jgi:hypothetical protein
MITRPAVESDINFILSTWLKSYYEELKRNGNKGVIYPKDDVFFQGHQQWIKRALSRSTALICTTEEDQNQIVGWIVYEDDTVHYVYVKNPLRKFGVAKLLLSKAKPKSYSHHTKYARFLNQGLVYDPYKF